MINYSRLLTYLSIHVDKLKYNNKIPVEIAMGDINLRNTKYLLINTSLNRK